MTTLEIIKDIVTIIASGTAATVAVLGLKAWKIQLKGKAEYELARRYLFAVYKVRDAIKNVRNPAIFSSEIEIATKLVHIDKLKKDVNPTDYAVYTHRLNLVNEALTILDIELLEAEIIWGVEAKTITKEIMECFKELYFVVRQFLTNRLKEDKEDVLYFLDENDEFNLKLNVAVDKIENYLRKHLK